MKLGRYLIGLASGLTFGMLFAPKKGKQIRKEIAKKSAASNWDALKVIRDAFMKAGNEACNEFQELSKNDQVKALKSLSKEKVQDLIELAEERGFDVAGKVQEKLEEISTLLMQEGGNVEKKAKKAVKKITKKVATKKRSVTKKITAKKKSIRKPATKKTTRAATKKKTK